MLVEVSTIPVLESIVLICDDRSFVREDFVRLLAPQSGPKRIRVVADGSALIEAFSACPADLVLVGLRRAAPLGAGVISQLLSEHPAAVVIVYGSARDADLLTAAITSGAGGLMLWDPTRGRLRPPWPTLPNFRQPNSGPGDFPPRLTERELQVLNGISDGRSNQEIGRHLFLTEDTVKAQARQLYRKLGAHDRAHAVALGFRQGLLTGHDHFARSQAG
jgi:DNA-binding NarL/FixJ family response regulator